MILKVCLKTQISKVNLPTLLQIAPGDPICDDTKARDYFQKLSSKDKILKEYANSKHEIYNDIERQQVLNDLKDYLGKI